LKRFKNILYIAGQSGAVRGSFDRAAALAQRNNAQLTVIQVIEKIPSYVLRLTPHHLRQIRLDKASAALRRLSKQSRAPMEIETKLLEGKEFLEIIHDVLRNGRDLVVKSVEPTDGIANSLFGSTDMHLLRKCPCPVWLIKSTDKAPLRRILAAVDLEEASASSDETTELLNQKILELAGSLADLEGAELHVVHAWHLIGEHLLEDSRSDVITDEIEAYKESSYIFHKRWFDNLMQRIEARFGSEVSESIKLKAHLVHGSAEDVIPQLSRDLQIDLVVMGTVARTGIAGLFIGNTAESILSQIDCSVLAVKPDGFVSPVVLNE